MDRVKMGSLSTRKTTEPTASIRSTQDVASLVTNPAEENPMKKLPQVSDTKLFVPLPVKIRKYSEDYLSQGFSIVMMENVPRPECVVCGEVLPNDSMKPSLLTRHLNTKHSDLKDKNVIFSNVY